MSHSRLLALNSQLRTRSETLLIGIGNADRGDDAAGLEVSRRLAAHGRRGLVTETLSGNPIDLLQAWRGRTRVILVDATLGAGRPGRVTRWDARKGALPRYLSRSSTHSFGIGEVVEMGRALGELPDALLVFGIEGRSFGLHRGLSPEVIVAVEEVVRRLAKEANAALDGRGSWIRRAGRVVQTDHGQAAALDSPSIRCGDCQHLRVRKAP